MTVETKKEKVEETEIKDDLRSDADIEVTDDDVNQDKLAALKAKLAKKEATKEVTDAGEEVTRSIKMGIVGSGQAGSRLAESFYKLGYNAVVINTAQQDLKNIELPEKNKLLLQHGLGGAGKELDIGHAAAESHVEEINTLVNAELGNCQLLVFCTSLGGGSGAGSSEVVVDILSQMECPVVVITVLPQASDDVQVKHNALQTLSKFTKMVQSRKIDNLIVVDNAKIETIYSDVGPLDFFRVSNQAIVEPIDAFNTLSSRDSAVKGLDPTEFGKLFTDGQGLTVYGTMKVVNYEDETAIAESVIENLNGSLLASGFDLKQARYVGAIFVASERVWKKIPSASINYAMSMIDEQCGNPLNVFKGIYTEDTKEDAITVYSMISGLALPTDRIEQLKTEAKDLMKRVEKKDSGRNLALKLDAEEETVSAAQAIKKKIQQKKSAFGKLHGSAVIDRRKK